MLLTVSAPHSPALPAGIPSSAATSQRSGGCGLRAAASGRAAGQVLGFQGARPHSHPSRRPPVPRSHSTARAGARHRLPQLLAGQQDLGHVLQLGRFLLHAAHALLHRRRLRAQRRELRGAGSGPLPPPPRPGRSCRRCSPDPLLVAGGTGSLPPPRSPGGDGAPFRFASPPTRPPPPPKPAPLPVLLCHGRGEKHMAAAAAARLAEAAAAPPGCHTAGRRRQPPARERLRGGLRCAPWLGSGLRGAAPGRAVLAAASRRSAPCTSTCGPGAALTRCPRVAAPLCPSGDGGAEFLGAEKRFSQYSVFEMESARS